MAAKKGAKKAPKNPYRTAGNRSFLKGNPGRPKGIKDKRTRAVHEIMDEHGIDPIDAQMRYAQILVDQADALEKDAEAGYYTRIDKVKLKFVTEGNAHLPEFVRNKVAKMRREAADIMNRVADYRHPKMRTTEMSGNLGLTWADVAAAEGKT